MNVIFQDMHCKYRVYLEEDDHVTEKISLTSNPDFNHGKVFKYKPVTRQLVDYLNNSSVSIQLMGRQYVRKSAIAAKKGLSTKEMLKGDRKIFSE